MILGVTKSLFEDEQKWQGSLGRVKRVVTKSSCCLTYSVLTDFENTQGTCLLSKWNDIAV